VILCKDSWAVEGRSIYPFRDDWTILEVLPSSIYGHLVMTSKRRIAMQMATAGRLLSKAIKLQMQSIRTNDDGHDDDR
jgi:hypothetical protein